MSFGGTLFKLRKSAGLSQEDVAQALEVTRQTVSKWETDVSTPELCKLQTLSTLLGVSYEALLGKSGMDPTDFSVSEALSEQIDWTAAWAGKYPILATYRQRPAMRAYEDRVAALCRDLQQECAMSRRDAMLALKDMLYRHYKNGI